jgi:predicted Rossmann fold nucleotide-binding protein DprA/Smf involved in DNA uptake
VDGGASTVDQLARATGLSPGAVAGILVELELRGVVEVTAGIVRR